MCKQENQQVIVDSIENAKDSFEEYPLWGNELGNDFFFREDVGMFYPIEYYEKEIKPLFGYSCGVCSEYSDSMPENIQTHDESADDNRQTSRNKKKKKSSRGGPLRGLQNHLRQKHHLTLCDLCVEFKRDFVALLPRFTPAQLRVHLSKGDGSESGFKGHPLCEFCRPKRFYDLTQLHMHLQKEHYKCHVCDKQGLVDQYFRNYDTLEHHFDRQHFLCKDPQCLAARFVVFENEIDLRAHELSVHGGTSSGSTKIQLEFKIRRSGYAGEGYDTQTLPNEADFQFGLDGQAFVPEALPPASGPNEETSHPLHFQRTEEMRAQAAEMRAMAEEESQEEAFPSLGGGTNSSGMRMGWTGNNPRLNKKKPSREEEFPSLPTSSARKKSTASSKIRASTNRQFTKMQSAASANTTNWGQGATSTVAGAPGTSRNDSFFDNSSVLRVNRQADLSADNFPELGPASKPRVSYPSSNIASSKVSSIRTRQGSLKTPSTSLNQQANLSSQNFPALGTAGRSRTAYPVNNMNQFKKKAPPSMDSFPSLGSEASSALPKPPKKAAPSISDNQHFPVPPTAKPQNTKIKEKLLKGTRNQNNSPLSDLKQGMVTVEEMKASLGTSKYKDLKNLTRDFATDNIDPDSYVEKTALLFGGDDDDFFRLVPALLLSCPNQHSAATALRYIEDLRTAQIASTAKASTATNTWSSASPELIPESVERETKSSGKDVRVEQANGKSQREWKASKKQGSKSGGGKKKKKQNNELKALAFGGN